MSYRYSAIKTAVSGHQAIGLADDVVEYDSRMEAKLAILLIREGIRFLPHRMFKVFAPDGYEFTYRLDFLFLEPQKFAGISHFVMGLEIKGRLKPHDFVRQEALKYVHGIRTYMVLDPLLDFWYEYGMNPNSKRLGEPKGGK